MSVCVTRKKMYLTQEMAEDALIDAWGQFDFKEGLGPVSIYRCDDCGAYHFTSQGEMNIRLAEAIATGKIRLQKEAARWMDKINKRR